jgi:aspartate/methionine/tyrosine aminotransferase
VTALKLRPEIEELGGNLIRDISLFGRRFENTIPLWFGEADSDTSPEIVAAAVDALTAGLVRYQPNQGYSPLVSALSEYMTRLYRPIDQDRILVTVGGMNALVLCTQAVVPSGGKVVTIGPYWPNLTAIARIGGAKVEYSNLIFNGRDWVLDLDHLL